MTGLAADVGTDTVESVIRGQLSKALGGRRGMAEGAVPTAAFTVCWFASGNRLELALAVGCGSAAVLLVVRLLQRQTVQFVLNSLVGIAIASIVALRSGNAQDVFLPGIIYNAVYAVVLGLSALVRWPAVGFLIGGVTGDPTGWHANPQVVRLCSRLTWLLALPCVARVLVQYPLWLDGRVGWLAVTKLVMGWPLQVAALAAMVVLLGRDHTPIRAD